MWASAGARGSREPFLLDALLHAVARHRREAVDEEHAVEVIDLVLDDLGLEALRFERDGLAVAVERRHADPLAALHVAEESRQRQAPESSRC